jgi:hypothetical protein
MAFKMKGSPIHRGDIQGTAGHNSALKRAKFFTEGAKYVGGFLDDAWKNRKVIGSKIDDAWVSLRDDIFNKGKKSKSGGGTKTKSNTKKKNNTKTEDKSKVKSNIKKAVIGTIIGGTAYNLLKDQTEINTIKDQITNNAALYKDVINPNTGLYTYNIAEKRAKSLGVDLNKEVNTRTSMYDNLVKTHGDVGHEKMRTLDKDYDKQSRAVNVHFQADSTIFTPKVLKSIMNKKN